MEGNDVARANMTSQKEHQQEERSVYLEQEPLDFAVNQQNSKDNGTSQVNSSGQVLSEEHQEEDQDVSDASANNHSSAHSTKIQRKREEMLPLMLRCIGVSQKDRRKIMKSSSRMSELFVIFSYTYVSKCSKRQEEILYF